MPFLLAILAMLVGSIPKTLNLYFLNPSNKVPSLEPMSIDSQHHL